MIQTSNPKIIFSEEGHEYWGKGLNTISVSRVIDTFHDEFDESYWHTYGAFKKVLGEGYFKELKQQYLKDHGIYRMPYHMMPPQELFKHLSYLVNPEDFFAAKFEVKQEWLDSQINGTKFHLERELKAYEDGFVIDPFSGEKVNVVKVNKEHDNQSLVDNLYDLEDGAYPELLVHFEMGNVTICGQVDLCIIGTDNEGVRYIKIDDIKTNTKLSKSSYFKFHKPYNHLDDCKVTKYQLQQSMYAYMLDLAGFEVRDLSITHYPNYDHDEGKLIPLEYLRDEAKSMFEDINELYAK